MAKYLARSCTRCNGYLGIVLRESVRNVPLQAVNGHCLRCGYRMSWIVVRGGQSSYGARTRPRLPSHGQQKTGTDAVNKAISEKPDLILLDIELPDAHVLNIQISAFAGMLLALFVTVTTVRQKKGPLKIDATLSLISENWLRHFSAAPASKRSGLWR